mmetsp:Transcript_14754/g.33892  ORF Transcript_14754/g.33892 Transcript_14754/m.33892 type:complete len:238 (-) Transcript_14754:24-737(-)
MCKPIFIELVAEEARKISRHETHEPKNAKLEASNECDNILLVNIQSQEDERDKECFEPFERNCDVNLIAQPNLEDYLICKEETEDQECHSCDGSVESLSDHAFSMEMEDDTGSIAVHPSFTEHRSEHDTDDKLLEPPRVSGMKRSSTFGRTKQASFTIDFKQYVKYQKENPSHIEVFEPGTCPFIQRHCSDSERCRKLLEEGSELLEEDCVAGNFSLKKVNAWQRGIDALFGLRIKV